MNNRQRALAVLNYKDYDKLPIVHFGFWNETLEKWAAEGHITQKDAASWGDGTPIDKTIGDKLGFDFNWYNCFSPATDLYPPFEEKVIEEMPGGNRKLINKDGVILMDKPGTVSIPKEIDHLLKDRDSWQEHYLPKLQFSPKRVNGTLVNAGDKYLPFEDGGLRFLQEGKYDQPTGLFCGSLFGRIRDWLGVEGVSYLYMDDSELFSEIIDKVADICYKTTEYVLNLGAKFDFAHFWEDICFKNGPLVIPSVFHEKVGPHYKRITTLLNEHNIDIISLDCDGLIDSLIPTWLENGVNTMFPMEVGTWNADIKPWREKFGRKILGVGGMNKNVFSQDYTAIEAEIERLKPLVDLGGYIPCPDHRIAPDAEWDNVRYYCDKMRESFV